MRFEREQCLDLDAAFARTWLLGDGDGATAAGCVLGCPASRWHGLLVAPVGPDGAPHLFLARLEEHLVEGARTLPVSSARYPGAIEPAGHAYLASFDVWPVPTWRYLLGDVEIQRTVELPFSPAGGLVRVTWGVSSPRREPRRLRVRPFLACRAAGALTRENPFADLRARGDARALMVQPYPDLPALHLSVSGDATFHAEPGWHRDYEHVQDAHAGLEAREDHLTPGVLEVTFTGDARIVLEGSVGAATSAVVRKAPRRLARAQPPLRAILGAARTRHARRTFHLSDWTVSLPWVRVDAPTSVDAELASADAGGSDAFHAHPRLESWWTPELSARPARVAVIAWAAAVLARPGLLGGRHPTRRFLVDDLFRAGHALRTLGPRDPVGRGCGLLSGGEATAPLGLDVVVSARWVAIARGLARLAPKARHVPAEQRRRWDATVRQLSAAFRERFWLEDGGHLADQWVDGAPQPGVRPGMLVAAAEPAVPLTKAERLAIVERARRELLTPRGLRTLSPRDPAYDPDPGPRAPQAPRRRNGAVEPRWLLPYAQATLLVHGRTPSVKARLRALVEGFRPHLDEHGLGCVAEVFDGQPPHRASGAPSDVRSLTALLEVLRLVGEGRR